MKKTTKEQRLPKFTATTLRPEELEQVTGGLLARMSLMKSTGCTAGTRSVCHVDGTDDGDYAAF
jgi:hypothetical protein